MKKILNFKRNTHGQALVEFSLILPLLIALILGMIEFGWILNAQITLTNVAREGARAAAVCMDKTAADSALTAAIAKSNLTGVTVNDSEYTNSWNSGDYVKVILSAPITPIIGLFVDTDSTGTITLTATSVMKIEN